MDKNGTCYTFVKSRPKAGEQHFHGNPTGSTSEVNMVVNKSELLKLKC